MADADAIVVGAGLAGLVAAAELADAGRRVVLVEQERGPTSAGRRSGRSAGCSSSTRRSSGGWASRTRSSSPGRTGWAAPGSTGRRTSGRGGGPGVRRLRRRREAGLAAGAGHAAVPGRRLGGARWRRAPTGTATPCPASTSPGAPAPAWWNRSCAGSRQAATRGWSAARSGTGSTTSSRRRGRDRCPRRGAGPSAAARGDDQLAARSATSRSRAGGDRHLRRDRRQPRPGPRRWPERLGAPPKRMIAGVPAHVDGRMLGITRRPAAA